MRELPGGVLVVHADRALVFEGPRVARGRVCFPGVLVRGRSIGLLVPTRLIPVQLLTLTIAINHPLATAALPVGPGLTAEGADAADARHTLGLGGTLGPGCVAAGFTHDA